MPENAEKTADSEKVVSDEKSLWTERTSHGEFGLFKELAPWSTATHILKGRAQREMLSKDLLLDLG